MKLERIQTVQRLPIQIEEAWDFFTSPKNLRLTTPHWLDLRLNMEPPEYLHPGTIVSATIRPFPVITTDWISELTHIRPPQFYITEQRVGPFKMWHHEHHFRAIDGGVEVEDIILYGMRYGMVGSFFHNVFVRKKLHEAFSHRAQVLEQRFGSINKPRQQEVVKQPTIDDVFQQQQQRRQPQQQPTSPLQQSQQQSQQQPKRHPSLQPPQQQQQRPQPQQPARKIPDLSQPPENQPRPQQPAPQQPQRRSNSQHSNDQPRANLANRHEPNQAQNQANRYHRRLRWMIFSGVRKIRACRQSACKMHNGPFLPISAFLFAPSLS